MLELSESFELEMPALDRDHQRLADIINQVVKLIDDGQPEACATLVPEFVDFAKKHFRREEAFLRKIGYPDAGKHHEYHSQLDGKMDTMLRLAQAVGNSKVAQESLRKEMIYFLMDDIINADLEFKAFIKARREAAARDEAKDETA